LIQQLKTESKQRMYDVIGIQSHMHGAVWSNEKIWDVCERHAQFGVPLHFTEMTILSGATGRGERRAAPEWNSTKEGEARPAPRSPLPNCPISRATNVLGPSSNPLAIGAEPRSLDSFRRSFLVIVFPVLKATRSIALGNQDPPTICRPPDCRDFDRGFATIARQCRYAIAP